MQGIIGSGAAMQRVFALLDKVIDTGTTVLIQGETGTGKELLAKVIHSISQRAKGPFVGVNVAASSKTLFEDDFFSNLKRKNSQFSILNSQSPPTPSRSTGIEPR